MYHQSVFRSLSMKSNPFERFKDTFLATSQLQFLKDSHPWVLVGFRPRQNLPSLHLDEKQTLQQSALACASLGQGNHAYPGEAALDEEMK